MLLALPYILACVRACVHACVRVGVAIVLSCLGQLYHKIMVRAKKFAEQANKDLIAGMLASESHIDLNHALYVWMVLNILT